MAKHVWFKDDRGRRDDFRLDVGFHNGPQCEACLEAYCEHCEDVDALDDCEAIIVIRESSAATPAIDPGSEGDNR